MKDQRLVTNLKRHEYYKDIYPDLHPNADEKKRTFLKTKPNFDFMFKNDKLTFVKEKERLDFSNTNKLFRSQTLEKPKLLTLEEENQKRLSFYLCNTMVPVIYTLLIYIRIYFIRLII